MALCASTGFAQDDVLVERPKSSTDAGYGFLQYLPPGYSTTPGRHAALLLMLHGSGEQGGGEVPELWSELVRYGPSRLLSTGGATVTTLDGGQKEARGGSRIFANEDVVIVAPQSPEWWNTTNLNNFMTWVMRRYRIDPRRIYVTGVSMGGGGTWNYVAGQGRDRIASALPICGAAGGGNGARFLKTKIWALHAWGDITVSRNDSIAWVSNIGDAWAGVDIPSVLSGYPHRDGGVGAPAAQTMTATYENAAFVWANGSVAAGDSPVRLTFYTDNAHDSWTRTYANADVWSWLFRYRSVVHPDFENAVVVDDLDDGFGADGGWSRLQPAAGGFYGWEELEAQINTSPSARFEGEVPNAGVYRFSASCVGGTNRTVTRVNISSAAGAASFTWDQRAGGTTRLGEVPVAGAFVVTLGSTASSGVLSADAIALGFVRPLDGGVPDAGVGVPDAGVGVPDAGVGVPDAGVGVPDAGVGVPDAGGGVPDAGGGVPDAGVGVPDAGVGVPDAGVGGPDAGVGVSDAGVEAPDAGVGVSDAGVGAPDAGVVVPVDDEPVLGGCGCSGVPVSTVSLLGLIALARRRRK